MSPAGRQLVKRDAAIKEAQMPQDTTAPACSGRCYCGRTTISASAAPKTVAYCHCEDCKRSTGAPVAAFAAFDEAAVTFSPDEGKKISRVEGVTRSFCPACGSPLTGRYDYLPDTIYVPMGLLDTAEDFPPEMHAHCHNQLCWLHLSDDLPRHGASARDQLNDS